MTISATPRPAGVLRALVAFPNPVNEVSARLVATAVVVMGLTAIVLDAPWLAFVIAYGFVARVLTGPTLSPLAQLVTRVVTPRLPAAPRPVAGPPKRFAQGIGAVVTTAAAILTVLGLWTAAKLVLALIVVAAFLEAALGFCIGCRVFALLMRSGVIPGEVCDRCHNIWSSRSEPVARAS